MRDETPTPTASQVFALRLFAQVCDGPRVLRDRLVAAGLDTFTIARVVGTSPRVIARVTDGGGTPRGVLMRMAGLVVVIEQLRASGVTLAEVSGPHNERVDEVITHLAAQSDIAARLLRALVEVGYVAPQLELGLAS